MYSFIFSNFHSSVKFPKTKHDTTTIPTMDQTIAQNLSFFFQQVKFEINKKNPSYSFSADFYARFTVVTHLFFFKKLILEHVPRKSTFILFLQPFLCELTKCASSTDFNLDESKITN